MNEHYFKLILNSIFTPRVTAEGFADFEIDEVLIKLGEIKRLDVKLETV